jgi:hypothetical protein
MASIDAWSSESRPARSTVGRRMDVAGRGRSSSARQGSSATAAARGRRPAAACGDGMAGCCALLVRLACKCDGQHGASINAGWTAGTYSTPGWRCNGLPAAVMMPGNGRCDSTKRTRGLDAAAWRCFADACRVPRATAAARGDNNACRWMPFEN